MYTKCNAIKKETLAHALKNSFLTELPLATASVKVAHVVNLKLVFTD